MVRVYWDTPVCLVAKHSERGNLISDEKQIRFHPIRGGGSETERLAAMGAVRYISLSELSNSG